MAWLALILTIAGLVYALGVRSFLAWRATGDHGLRTATGPAGSASWWAKYLFIASVVLVIAGPVIALTTPKLLIRPVPITLSAIGIALAVAGIAAVAAAQNGMGSSWRVGVDVSETTGLVTGGLFTLARNPIFTAMTAFAAGVALVVPSAVSVLAVAALVLAIQVQVRFVEEPYLTAVHGDAYRRYAAQTGRFLPGIGRFASS
jgi:protein-S-isoprenylcysteine O-methyltransferase Ste14